MISPPECLVVSCKRTHPMKRHRVVECLSVLLLICFSQLGRAAALAVPGPYGRSVDVTAKTGERIEGKLVSWQTPNGTANVEHLAGRSPDGQLLVFYWSPQADWRVVNVSKKTGYLVSHPLVAWQTPSGH